MLLLTHPFAICSTLSLTFSSTGGSHLLFTRFLGVDVGKKGLEFFALAELQQRKQDEKQKELSGLSYFAKHIKCKGT
jgi:hypothetical protein